jgi:hypothetical protein
MRGVTIIIEGFDPPIALSTYLPGRTQDDRFKYLPRFDGLHCSDQTIPAILVSQSAFAPLLFVY